MPKYVLHYFNFRGRGELIRLMFFAASQPYVEREIEFSNWPKIKSSTPFGQLPYLEVYEGGRKLVLAQSLTIARFLAKRFNMAGQNEYEQSEAEMYGDQINDLYSEYARAVFEKDEARKNEQLQKLQNETIPNNLRAFESRLARSQSGYLIGNGLTWVDLFLMNLFENLITPHPQLSDKFPLLRAHQIKISSIPNVAFWIQTRPKTDM